jgi:hypothetical protein
MLDRDKDAYCLQFYSICIHPPVMLRKQGSVLLFADNLAAGAVTSICKNQLIAYKNLAKNGS